jgi:hypothetical protein
MNIELICKMTNNTHFTSLLENNSNNKSNSTSSDRPTSAIGKSRIGITVL